MAPSILNLEDQDVSEPEQRDDFFSTAQLPQRRFPVRGLLYSIVVHGMLLAAAVSIPWNYWLPPASPLVEYTYTPISPKLDEPLLLPALAPAVNLPPAPAKEGTGAAGAGGHTRAAMNRAFRGVVHKGPQVIVSDPPKPDNFVQTIRQDSLVNPPIFPIALAVPNVVAVAPAAPVLRAQPQAPVEPAKQPVAAPPATLASDTVEVVPPPPEVPASTPKLGVVISKAQAAQVAAPAPPPPPESVTPNSTKNLVIVSAVPIATTKEIKLPPGELHGAFAVSPTPPAPSGKNEKETGGPGSAANGSPTLGRGKGPGTHGGTRGGNGEGSATAGAGKGAPGNGSGHSGTGSGPRGNGETDNGSGNGKGVEIASAGSNTLGGPFSNIRIDGGSGNAKSASAPSRTPAGTYDYGITIVASASSGGGLKDYGVFHNEPVYTVFVDMADTSSVSWTLQYSVLRPAGSTASQVQELITPPYPIEKNAPHFAPELSARFAGRLIVIQGIITPEGKVQNLKIIQSPHPYLGDALIAALQKDTFKPAESAGKAIGIKFLLGVPISAAGN